MKTLLHVGCGPQNINNLKGFANNNWTELRFDIDETVKPDIIGTLTDMSSVKNESVDAIYSSHNIEHIFPHEISVVFNEFIRILRPSGFLVISCPDLQSVCEHVAKGNIENPLYISPAGPISALDILYGHNKAIELGNTYMAHKCGFTWTYLNKKLHESGFQLVYGGPSPATFALNAIACKSIITEYEAKELFNIYSR